MKYDSSVKNMYSLNNCNILIHNNMLFAEAGTYLL